MIPSQNPYLPFPEDENASPSRRLQPFELELQMQAEEDGRQQQSPKQRSSSRKRGARSGGSSPSRKNNTSSIGSGLFVQSASPERNKSRSRSSNNKKRQNSSQRAVTTSTKLIPSSSQSISTTNTNNTHSTSGSTDASKKIAKELNYYSPPSSPISPEQPLSYRPYKGFSTPFCGLFAASASVGHPQSSLHNHQNATAASASPSHNIGNTKNYDDDNNNIDDSFSSRQQHYYHTKQSEIHRANRRTDLCSLACFGILQSDYTRYLFTHTRPPTLCKRMWLHLLTPLSLFILAGWCSGNIRNEYVNSVVCTALVYCIVVWIFTACCRGRKKRVMVRDELLWRLRRRDETLKLRLAQEVKRGREKSNYNIAEKCDDDDGDDDEEEYDYDKSGCAPPSVLGQSRREMHCAHRMWGCYPSDVPRNTAAASSSYSYPYSPTSMQIRRRDGYGGTAFSSPTARECNTDDYVLQPDSEHNIDNNNVTDDLCTKLWRMCCTHPLLPCMPSCNGSYGFHLQCCGLCALAQEAREANIAFPRHLRMMDYITMEPFLLYYPRILELRSSATSSFWAHIRALSELSKLLLVSFKAILLALLIISLSDAVKNWNLADMAVLVTTFLQSFVVMYCVHWGWHRFDLSIDAVIKYFACGFVLCTSMAFAVEFCALFVYKMTTLIVVGLLDVQEVQDNGYGGSSGMQLAADDTDTGNHRYLTFIYGIENDNQVAHDRFLAAIDDILEGFFDRQPFAKILYMLVSAYLMAGLVEELCKYFGFFMVDHPDFCSEKELEKSNASLQLQLRRDHSGDENDEDEAAENAEQPNAKDGEAQSAAVNHASGAVDTTSANATFRPEMQRRSLSSIRSGVTVAMVAVALGFACCENVFHIFIYNRSSVKSEIATLIVKSLFPIHPIAAAIQSIYVCRRDLEGDTSIGIGRTVLPSIILRGTYEFSLLMIGWSSNRGYNNFYQEDHVTGIALSSFCVSLFLVLGGGYFYRRCSQAQYARLQDESECNAPETSFGLMV